MPNSRYDCDGNPNHTAGDNNSTTSEANKKPEVIRKVVRLLLSAAAGFAANHSCLNPPTIYTF